MNEIDIDELAQALASFTRKVSDAFDGDISNAVDHIRNAAGERSTLIGSARGRDLWESPEGKALIDTLFKDPEIFRWYGGGAPADIEMKGVLASGIAAIGAADAHTEAECAQHAPKLVEALKATTRGCYGYALIYGVSVGESSDLAGAATLHPDGQRLLDWLAANDQLTEIDLMRLPKGYGGVMVIPSAASREEFGAIASSTAWALVYVIARRVCTAIWLASGTRPVIGDLWVAEHGAYPTTPIRRVPPGLQSYPSGEAYGLSEREIDLARDILRRQADLLTQAPTGVADGDTYAQLRLAESQSEVIEGVKDPVQVALLAYVTLDGLVREKSDPDSAFGPRLAWLVGTDVNDRRDIRKFTEAYGTFRGSVGHGSLPDLDVLGRLIGRTVTREEFGPFFSWLGNHAGQILQSRCVELLRRAALSFLCLSVIVNEDGTVKPGLTRDELIKKLDGARNNEQSAIELLERNARGLFDGAMFGDKTQEDSQ